MNYLLIGKADPSLVRVGLWWAVGGPEDGYASWGNDAGTCEWRFLPSLSGNSYKISYGWTPQWNDVKDFKVQLADTNDVEIKSFTFDHTLTPEAVAASFGLTVSTSTDPKAAGVSFVDFFQETGTSKGFRFRISKTETGKTFSWDSLLYSSDQPIPAPAHLDTMLSPGGKSLLILIRDTGENPRPIMALTTLPSVSVNGGPLVQLPAPDSGSCVSSIGNFSYLLWPLFGPKSVLGRDLGATDVVTVTAPDGWARSPDGLVSGASAMVSKRAAALLPPAPTGHQTMEVGYNVGPPASSCPVIVYANLARQSIYWPPNMSYGPDGYPISLDSWNNTLTYVISGWVDPSDNTRQYFDGPSGTYTVQYRSELANFSVFLGSLGMNTQVSTPRITRLADGRIRVQQDVQTDPKGGPNIFLAINKPVDLVNDPTGAHGLVDGPYPLDIKDLEIYAADVDPDNPPIFDPNLVRMAHKSRCLRLGGMFGLNSNNVVDFDDFYDPSLRLSCSQGKPIGGKVVSLAPYDNSDGYYDASGSSYTPVLMTFAAPHGFKDGQTASANGFSGPSGDGTFPIGGGTYVRDDGAGHKKGDVFGPSTTSLNLATRPVHFISPTEIAFQSDGVWQGSPTVLSGTFTTGLGTLTSSVQVGVSPADCFSLCNQVGSDAWFNVPHLSTDDCVRQIATLAANRLNHGLKLYVEFSNETWNWSGAFTQTGYCANQGRLSNPPISNNQWTVKRSGEIFTVMKAAWVAAGRSATDCLHVIGTQGAWSGVASERVSYAAQNHIAFDRLAVAPYFSGGPDDQSLAALFDSLDQDQLMDVAESYMAYSGTVESFMLSNKAVLNTYYPSAELVCYEGGPEYGGLTTMATGNTRVTVLSARSRAWARHPRMRGIMLHYLQLLQDKGFCTLFNDYTLYGLINSVVASGDAMWSCYNRWNQQPGLGDGSDGLFDNRTNYDDLEHIVSVVGGAINTWQEMVAKPVVLGDLYAWMDGQGSHSRLSLMGRSSTRYSVLSGCNRSR